jgi:PAS domain S-box-containing protein
LNDFDAAAFGTQSSPIDLFEWKSSLLGPRDTWSNLLKNLADVMLASNQPMFIAWGVQHVLLYNGAFAALPASGHPQSLGAALQPPAHDTIAGMPFNITTVYDEAGEPCGIVGTLAAIARDDARQTARLLHSFVEALPGVVYAKDLQGRMLVANRGTAELIGKPPAAFLGKTDAENLEDEAEAAAIMATDARIMQSGIAEQVEEAVRLPNGQPAVWFSTKAPLHDENGRVIGLIGTSIDVTERSRLEARRLALVELADRFRDLEDPADIAYTAAEILGRTLDVSRAGYGSIDPVLETISVKRDWNLPGIKSLAGMLHFRDYGSYIEDLKRGETVVFADADKDPRTRENAQALKDISAWAAINMPLTEQGQLVAILYLNHATAREWPEYELEFIRDVAMRTRAAVARRQAELELQALAASLEQQVAERTAERDRVWRNSRDLLVVLNAEGTLHLANPAWQAVLGYAPEDVNGKNYADFVLPDDVSSTGAALATAIGVHDVSAFENRCRHADGSFRWISWHTSMENAFVFAYGRDVTEEKAQAEALQQAESALRQSQKMEAVGQLTGGIAHDFNNMLAVVIGSLELLARRLDGGDSRAQRYVESATEGAKRAALLTQRLLAFSRQQPLRPESIDANRLVSGMSDLLRRSLGAEIQLEAVLAGGLWRTHADPNQLENVILNLAVNARDAMPEGGRLTIETQNAHLDARYVATHLGLAAGQYVLIAVTDTGMGMPEEVIAKAFDPFFTTKAVGKGTGLGLSQVYGFVKQSGGHVKIYSEPGEGTTVKIYLPRQAAGQQETDAQDIISIVPRGQQREVVLVVEDEPAVRELSVEALSELGYRVLEADGAAAALRLIDAHPDIALLFTDVVMPEVNGRKLAAEACRRRKDLKVLFTTGYTRNAVVHNGVLDAGVELIGKPFTIEELAAKVRAVLDS